MKELRDLSEKKLEAVKARASDEAALASGVDDLEADETPESLMLLTLQVEVRDKTAKELHTALLYEPQLLFSQQYLLSLSFPGAAGKVIKLLWTCCVLLLK